MTNLNGLSPEEVCEILLSCCDAAREELKASGLTQEEADEATATALQNLSAQWGESPMV